MKPRAPRAATCREVILHVPPPMRAVKGWTPSHHPDAKARTSGDRPPGVQDEVSTRLVQPLGNQAWSLRRPMDSVCLVSFSIVT